MVGTSGFEPLTSTVSARASSQICRRTVKHAEPTDRLRSLREFVAPIAPIRLHGIKQHRPHLGWSRTCRWGKTPMKRLMVLLVCSAVVLVGCNRKGSQKEEVESPQEVPTKTIWLR
jgi:hypothetical protein